jgi:hypothetical protein
LKQNLHRKTCGQTPDGSWTENREYLTSQL